MNLENEKEHWMGYSLKEYREKYEELVSFSLGQQFQIILMEKMIEDLEKTNAGLDVPTGRKQAKKDKGRH